MNEDAIAQLAKEYARLGPQLNERERRLWAGTHAKALGRGGPTLISQATGLTRPTVYRGMRELDEPAVPSAEPGARVRRPGGGRKPLVTNNTLLRPALNALIEPMDLDAESTLRWTTRSTTALARMLQEIGHQVEARTVAMLLQSEGFRLQMNRHRGREGTAHPDRNEQCEYLAERVREFDQHRQPAVVVELSSRAPRENQAEAMWVSRGIARRTAALCSTAVEGWWRELGRPQFPRAKQLMIAADGGHGAERGEAWETALRHLADNLQLELSTHYFPPVTARWRNIEGCSYQLVWLRAGRAPRFRAHVDLVTKPSTGRATHGVPLVVEEHRETWAAAGRVRARIQHHERLSAWNYAVLPRAE